MILLYSRQIAGPLPYKKTLKTFADAGILNVAILQPQRDTDILFAYLNPFPTHNQTVTFLRNPKDWTDAFPDKLKDLQGHQLNLHAIHKPPGAIVKKHPLKVRGIQAKLFESVIRRWNATFLYTPIEYLPALDNYSILCDLFINRYPYYSGIVNTGYELLPANEQDQVRIMVRYKKANFTFDFVRRNFFGKTVVILLSIFFCYYTLHYILFHRKKDVLCMSICNLMPMSLRQPVFVKFPTRKERIFLVAGLWMAFICTTMFECQFTSTQIAYYPNEKVSTIEKLTTSKFRVYADIFVHSLLMRDRYNLSEKFLDKVQLASGLPWRHEFGPNEYAHVIGMGSNYFFFDSVFNIDRYGYEKFYLLDHVITTTPMVYAFPIHSPFREAFQNTKIRMSEAGLRRYWEVTSLRQEIWEVWHSFRSYSKEGLQRAVFRNQTNVATILIISGWLLSVVCLLLEVLWRKFVDKPRRRNGLRWRRTRYNQKRKTTSWLSKIWKSKA